jgi:DNA (cytosine-5)-methyltransferase 1
MWILTPSITSAFAAATGELTSASSEQLAAAFARSLLSRSKPSPQRTWLHLWPHISAGIAAMRPAVCFFENVEGHISLGLRDVLQDLVGLGYRATWCVASASECGAPHQRKRIWILAYRNGDGFLSDVARATALAHSDWPQDGISGADGELVHSQRARMEGQQPEYVGADAWASGECGAWPSRPGEQQFAWEPPRVVGNAAQRQDHGREPGDVGTAPSQGRCGHHAADGAGEAMGNATSPRRPRPKDTGADRGHESQGPRREESERAGAMGHTNSPRPQERPRQRGAGIQGADADGGEAAERQTQSPLGRDADGPADWLDDAELYTTCDNRTDELRLLGNGVVPACAERAFRLLVGELRKGAN